jgi:hypothetical protein
MPISTEAKACYLCKGEKLIRVRCNDGDRYLGCPACKTDKRSLIGEGWSLTPQADSAAIVRLAADVLTQEEEDARARAMAAELGMRYEGRQEWPGKADHFFFTDLLYGGSFLVPDLCLVAQRLVAIRTRFAFARIAEASKV